MIMDVTHENSKISFTHLKKKRMRHVYLTVDKQQGVVLKSGPRLSGEAARKIVLEKAVWIKEKLATVHDTVATGLHDIQAHDYLILGGKKLPLRVQEDSGLKKIRLHHDQNGITLLHPGKTAEQLQKSIENFYKEQTIRKVTPMIDHQSQRMGLFPESVSYRKYKRRWGCCDVKNRLTFHSLLSQFSDDIIEYIVIHELAHIREKNHSKRFWALVEIHCPHYKQIHKKIKGSVDAYQ